MQAQQNPGVRSAVNERPCFPSGRSYNRLAKPDVSQPLLVDLIRQSWSRETAYDAAAWTRTNPASGQCAVTALVLQHYLGGELLRGQINGQEHYWNLLPHGEIDLTREQFEPTCVAAAPSDVARDYVLSFPDTVRRYTKLLKSVRARLGYARARAAVK
jgi:hypothetical protein